ncbi:hypothetical protein GCM10010341_66350 [Streptomyces noursei]|nr:hypothetical protein GCM10010341_66350 [Streptomyces noursei]
MTTPTTDGYETILVERTGRTTLLTLNRPKALNVFDLRLMNEVVAATEALDRDPECGCIVLTGSAWSPAWCPPTSCGPRRWRSPRPSRECPGPSR